MIKNDAGWIALKRYQTINKIISIGSDEYLFQTRANICMSWIRPEHVDAVLAIKKMCCGGNKKPMFKYANEDDVRRWTNGGGR